MAKTRITVIDLLAEQPEDVLSKMREANRKEYTRLQDELARLKVEGQQIDEALARHGRSGTRSGLTGEQVYSAMLQPPGRPLTAAEVHTILAERGHEATVNAVRNHLNRLVTTGQLARQDNRYSLPASEVADIDFGGSASDDEIPF